MEYSQGLSISYVIIMLHESSSIVIINVQFYCLPIALSRTGFSQRETYFDYRCLGTYYKGKSHAYLLFIVFIAIYLAIYDIRAPLIQYTFVI